MKILAISQRVDRISKHQEQRDCLDQRWASLSHNLGFIPVPLPNLSAPEDIISTVRPAAIILSGGGTLTKLDPTARDISPTRDKFEQELLRLAIKNNIPVLGVCRGMQLINMFFGGGLSKVSEHVACRHPVEFTDKDISLNPREINSFHNWGIKKSQLADSLRPFAISQDKTIEGFKHKELPVAGIMWHPEREEPNNEEDLRIIKNFLS